MSPALTDVLGLRDALEPEQRPFAVVDDGAAEQLPFAFERDFVGALRRGQRRDDDADDRDRDDDAERHHHAQACPVPSGRLSISLARR